MGAVFDHAFIMCSVGAPEADALVRLGLVEGSPNSHPGQGTACRRFFFENAYLELLWVHDEQEVRSEAVRATRLWERWSERRTGASPFGIVVRPAPGNESGPPPFDAWSYAPGYLPAGSAIDIAIGTPLAEPEFLRVGFERRRVGDQPINHRIPARIVTGVLVGCPCKPESQAAQAIERLGWLSFEHADTHVLRLTFERGASRESADLRPHLPLVLSW